MKINLGCGTVRREGYLNIDHDPDVKPDRVVDLFKFPWPFLDSSADTILCEHIVEHIPHTIPGIKGDGFFAFMREVDRILKPDGRFIVRVPSWRNRRWAETDPTHTRTIWPRTWDYTDSARLGRKAYVAGKGLGLTLEHHKTTGYEARWEDRLRIRGIGLATHLMIRLPFLAPLLRYPTEETYILRKRRDGETAAPIFRDTCCASAQEAAS